MQRIYLMLLLIVLSGLPLVQPRQSTSQNYLVLTHVTVIDVTGGPAQPGMTVEIKDGRVIRIHKSSEALIAKEAQFVDATGQFLIPGLWDMHVHVLRENRVKRVFPQLVANGVLGIRDMGSPLLEPDIREWHRRIEKGDLLAPRVVASGPMIDGAEPMFPELSISAKDESEARQGVNFLKQSGANFIKVYSLLSREAYFAIADESKKQDIVFAGHVPDWVSASEASDAGQKSIEHLSGVLLACSTSEEELRNELLQARAQRDPAALYKALRLIQAKGTETFDNEKAEALFRRFVHNETWQVPTLVAIWNIHESSMPEKSSEGKIKSLPMGSMSGWDSSAVCCLDFSWFDQLTVDERERLRDILQGMRKAGVEFMAGTDTPNIWGRVGQSLHKELALFVRAGFTPMEALQTATRNPAKYLGMLDSLGTVEAGKFADLVLLDANPLEDIANTQSIAAVILRGKLISKSELLEAQQIASREKSRMRIR
jgi:imidazolonepropionase-like amidohydrolase